ncbi:MAG: hydroxymethylglutaryl-CoA synthase [Streptococcaceae bacterium]|nr:hydroxymethylglutaryl-CoA synthase [Streptococcaceae bacterium]
MTIGIDKLSFYVPPYVLDMDAFAAARGEDPEKFHTGLEIDEMAVTSSTQDIVTLAANAASQLLTDEDRAEIDQIIVATESSVDESKAAAVILHGLLKIQPFARAIELKEACYGATAALLLARDAIYRKPESKILVIATDIARYGLNTPGEATQGAGAVAMLVTQNPRLLVLHDASVSLTQDIYDFWRPTGETYPRVNGKLSNETYLDAFEKVWAEYQRRTQKSLEDFAAIVFHSPYPKMGKKALNRVTDHPRLISMLTPATTYNRRVGNLYTGSLYLSLVSLLENAKNLKAGDTIGLFSYGSGTVSEFFTAQLVPRYETQLRASYHQSLLDNRQQLTMSEYEGLFTNTHLYKDTTPFALESIIDGERHYHVD